MTDQNNNTADAPDNWERYGEMLRRQPAPTLSPERASAMMARIDAGIDRGSRRPVVRRWMLAPAAGLVALVVILWLSMINTPPAPTTTAPQSESAASSSTQAPRQPRRQHRRQLQPPAVPESPVPASVDSAIPHLPVPQPHRIDTGVSESYPGPSPGPRYPAPSPGPRR